MKMTFCLMLNFRWQIWLKRVVVNMKMTKLVGILDQISLSSFFATNTSLSNQIVKAETLKS